MRWWNEAEQGGEIGGTSHYVMHDPTTSSLSFLTLEYYQGFYDVTTAQVRLPLTSPIVISSLGGTAVVGRDGTMQTLDQSGSA